MAQKIYKKMMHLNYKQYNQRLRDTSDRALQDLTVEDQCPTVADLLAIPIANYINMTTNSCEYSGPSEELLSSYIHPLFI